MEGIVYELIEVIRQINKEVKYGLTVSQDVRTTEKIEEKLDDIQKRIYGGDF